MFEALAWLFIKHFICDFPLQACSWMHLNKGRYGHPGGLTHAGIHALGTLTVLAFFQINAAWMFALADFAVHYHIDWAKINADKKFNLKPGNSEWFWILLGFDQLLHHLTYFAIIRVAFSH